MLRLFVAAAVLLAAPMSPTAPPSGGASMDVAMPIGAREAPFAAALASAHIDAKRERLPNGGSRFTYRRGADVYTVETSPWPNLGAPETAYLSPSPSDPITVTRVHIAGPSSDAKRKWMKALERDGRAWAKTPDSFALRSAEDKKRYGVSAAMQWWDRNPDPKVSTRVPSATFLFQAERPPNTPYGSEPTILDVYLENPWHPRRL